MRQKLKKVAVILSVTAGVLILAAIIIGVLNGLLGDGSYVLGWSNYRYDETGYMVGAGTVPSETVHRIQIDWIDGEVEVVRCRDTFISITETVPNEIPKSAEVRWKVEEDGTLQIKYRKSDWFFNFNSNAHNKKLTLRIPERFFSQLSEVTFTSESANAVFNGIAAEQLHVKTASGNVTLSDCTVSHLQIETGSGKVTLQVPSALKTANIATESGRVALTVQEAAAFALQWESVSGEVQFSLPVETVDGAYLYGVTAASEAPTKLKVETVSGGLSLDLYE